MTRPVAAGEPTMDDILASIRKIIAEEPAAVPTSTSGGGPFAAPIRAGEPQRAAGEEPHKPGGSALFGRLSEALRGGPSTTAPAGAPRSGVAGIDDDLADMLEAPAPRSPASLPLRDGSATRGTGLPLPAGRRDAPFGGPLVSAPPPPPPGRIEPSLGALPAQAGRDGGSRPADLGAVVPARQDASRPADPAGAPPFGRRINESAPAHDVAPHPQAPRPLPEVIAAMPTASSAPAAAAPAPTPTSAATPVPEKAPAVPVAAAAPTTKAKPISPPAAAVAAGPTVIAAMPAAPPSVKPSPAAADPDTTAAAQSALSMLAMGLKASATLVTEGQRPASPAATGETAAPTAAPPATAAGAAPASVVAAAALPVAPTGDAPVPRDASAMRSDTATGASSPPAKSTAGEAVAEAPAPSPQPAVPAGATVIAAAPLAEPAAPVAAANAAKAGPPAGASAAAAPAPQSPISLAAAATVGDVRTLEDTVAELLRPMLRQWLDDNMPRIVEKALRVEIAGRPLAPHKTR